MKIFEYNAIIILLAALCLLSKNPKAKTVFFVIAGIQMILVLALRDWQSCGIDLLRYYNTYDFLSNGSIKNALDMRNGSNVLYFLTNTLLAKAGMNYQIFVSLISVNFILSVVYLYQKKADCPLISIFFFLGMGVFLFSFSGLKQTIAMTITIWCYLLHDAGKTKLSYILLAIAMLYHPTAIVFLPLLVARNIPVTKLILVLSITAFIIVLIFRMQIGSTLTLLYAEEYIGKYESTSSLTETSLLLILFFGMLLVYKPVLKGATLKERIKFNDSFYILLFAIFIQICASFSYSFTRINYYYMLLVPISISNIINYSKYNRFVKIVGLKYAIFCTIIIYLTYNLYISGVREQELENYQFISFLNNKHC